MARLLLLIASPRAGSTNFERLLRSFEGGEAFGEIFHPTGGTSAKNAAAFLDRRGVEHGGDPSRARAAARAIVRADPVAACGELLEMAAERGAVVAEAKLFAGFLPARTLDAILSRFRPVCVRLHRAPIDAFISYEKARMAGAWRSVDTTGLRPGISARAFGFWKWKQENFYQMAGYLMARNGIAPVDLAYEDLYRDEDAAGRLGALLAGQGLDIGRRRRGGALARQDRAQGRAEKVADWEGFLADHRRRAPEAGLSAWRFEGSRAALWGQMQAERVVPREAMRRVAASLVPLAQQTGVLRA
jgi:LPS sulfotransferase NodH